jgi:hypothetical protein
VDGRPARRDIALTAIAAVLVAAFCGLCYWQVRRAVSGNTLSWAYVFEWPLFAGYVVYMWWRLTHDGPGDGADDADTDGGGHAAPAPPLFREEEDDPELAAYNRYLAELHEQDRHRR